MDAACPCPVCLHRTRTTNPRQERRHPHPGHRGPHRLPHDAHLQVRVLRHPHRRHHPLRSLARRLADRVGHRLPGRGHHPDSARSDPRPNDGRHHLGHCSDRHGLRRWPVVARPCGHCPALHRHCTADPARPVHPHAHPRAQGHAQRPLQSRTRSAFYPPHAGQCPGLVGVRRLHAHRFSPPHVHRALHSVDSPRSLTLDARDDPRGPRRRCRRRHHGRTTSTHCTTQRDGPAAVAAGPSRMPHSERHA